MKLLSTHRHRVAATVTAVVVTVGGASAAVAVAMAPGSSITPASLVSTSKTGATPATGQGATAHKHGRHHHGGLIARTDHATAEVRIKGQWVTLGLDRGQVTAVSSSAITLMRPDGHPVTIKIDAATKYSGGATSATSVQTGRRATVISDDGTARRIVEAKPGAHHGAAKGSTSAGDTAA
jgi:hypothetical protein